MKKFISTIAFMGIAVLLSLTAIANGSGNKAVDGANYPTQPLHGKRGYSAGMASHHDQFASPNELSLSASKQNQSISRDANVEHHSLNQENDADSVDDLPNKGYIHFATEQKPHQPKQMLSLDSSVFGFTGPFSFDINYSRLYGFLISGQYTSAFNAANAWSLLFDVGSRQRRVNFTWGVLLGQHQRFKASAEYLSQNMLFAFDSGDVRKWQSQPALGASYQYQLSKGMLRSIDINAFYSQASSENLPSKDYYTKAGIGYRNYRRIAGGQDKSISAGVHLLPTSHTLLGLALNYDHVDYPTHYSGNNDLAGLGMTVSLAQLLTQHLKLQLLASKRYPINTYQAQLSYLLPTRPGTTLEIGINGERDIGKDQLDNDSRIGLKASYSFGGSDKHLPAVYTMDAQTTNSDLKAWTAQPAVHMSQVLAIVDQKSVLLNSQHKGQVFLSNNRCSPYAPHNNPTVKIPEQHVAIGEVVDKDLGMLSTQEQSEGGLFTAPRRYPASSVKVSGLDKTGLALYVKLAGNIYHLYLKGIVAKDAGTSSVSVIAVEPTFGFCPDQSKTFNIIITGKPVINPIPLQTYRLDGKAIVHPLDLTHYIKASAGIDTVTLTPQSGSQAINHFVSYDSRHAKILATPARATTPNTQTYKVIVTDKAHQQAKGQFQLNIIGKPLPRGQLPAMKVNVGNAISTVDLGRYFVLPNAQSPAISDYQVSVRGPQGATTLAALNLVIDHGQLRQRPATTIPSGTAGNYTLSFTATNKVGRSTPNVMLLRVIDESKIATLLCPKTSAISYQGGQLVADVDDSRGHRYHFHSANLPQLQAVSLLWAQINQGGAGQFDCVYKVKTLSGQPAGYQTLSVKVPTAQLHFSYVSGIRCDAVGKGPNYCQIQYQLLGF